MEVHQHAHHEGKKNWKSYLWEFLMLFLAVFCGFLAEYQLEHVIEHKKEKQYIESFIEDLKSDTTRIRQNIANRERKALNIDSLMYLLSNQKIKGYENDLYYFGRIFIRSTYFTSNDRTITQLKSSGSLRLIRNEQAADSMIAYRQSVENLYLGQDYEQSELANSNLALSRMFNPYVFDTIVNNTGIKRPSNNPPLRSYDPNIQQDFAFWVHQVKGSEHLIIPKLQNLHRKANNIIAFLKREYHLE